MKTITDLDLKNKRVLIRVDYNVPMEGSKIKSDVRIQASLPTIETALEKGAAVILLSHLGSPQEGVYDESLSLFPVAERLSHLLKKPIRFEKNWLNGVDIHSGEIVLCENVRFNVGEMENQDELSKKMATLCDVFINDAFATAHRVQASTYGIARYVKEKAAGLLMIAELNAIQKAIQNPKRPVVTIIGGSKISTKLELLHSLLDFSDTLIVGGGIANTLLTAKGFPIGKSLCEKDLFQKAQGLFSFAENKNVPLPLPIDAVIAKNSSSPAEIKNISDLTTDDIIYDIGPKTARQFGDIIKNAKTIIWNGPVGMFEIGPFSHGTKQVASDIANSHAYSLVGGGDTIAALEKFKLDHQMSYISTGGGAFLSYLEASGKGEQLPTIEILERQ